MTPSNAQEIGMVIRNLRQAKGLTQEELAERMKSALSYVGRLERGESNVTLKTLERVAEALDTTFFQLVAFAAPQDDDLIHEIIGLLHLKDQETKERMILIIRHILALSERAER